MHHGARMEKLTFQVCVDMNVRMKKVVKQENPPVLFLPDMSFQLSKTNRLLSLKIFKKLFRIKLLRIKI